VVHSVSVNVEAAQYLAGYRPEAGHLFLPTLSESRVGENVAVRVGIYGQTIRATLFGRISHVRRVGRPALPPGIELRLDQHCVAAAGFLAMAARGEPVTFQERLPRWSHERTLPVEHAGTALEAVTLNVSDGGCAVRWPGQLPLVGDVVAIRLGEGMFAPTAQAIVCWNQPGGAADRSVGLRIVSGGRAGRAWRALVKKVSRSGARAA
jgi:Tfp pilus assembly protein PilZ